MSLSLGLHAITLGVTDTHGESGTDSMLVSVVDTVPPVVGVVSDPLVLWPPNHRMVTVALVISTEDVCDPTPLVSLASVTSSEPDDAPGDGDGHTDGDITLGAADTEVLLRAERAGSGTGRFYTIAYTATDSSGNPGVAEAGVLVPHEQGGRAEPVEVEITRSVVGATSSLSWSAVAGDTSYNVFRGSISGMSSIGSFTVVQNAACLGRALATPALSGGAMDEDPAIGEAFFYVVEYFDGGYSGYGTATGGGEVVIISGDSCH